jgi:hypothetical protein
VQSSEDMPVVVLAGALAGLFDFRTFNLHKIYFRNLYIFGAIVKNTFVRKILQHAKKK